ncbi:674_t:CDS:2 [Paraglomus brasilianum]|uniref:674_t:CDS:1 n=1 Tax=Paraglomus brasilianum TaxID=144538 RepID=A0A9N9GSQ9_9GLOM|nr:674_t:CDS:2 [Paraglomus brasilianum]
MRMERIAPLERSENRWVSLSVAGEIPKAGEETIEMIKRKVKALLNKLTLEKFEIISDHIIEFANKSKEERDGRILKTVIQLTFEKACDEPNFSQMYAQLCRKMMERIDMDIFDENIKNASDEYFRGGTLFRKYLLNRCQDGFEKGWKANMPIPNNVKGEPDLLSDEYYIAAKAKRHGLGVIKFIGELFKLHMLTERIMHECIKKLLANHQDPEEEKTESLCELLTIVGKQLDHPKAKDHMDAHFVRMDSMSKNTEKLNSRIRVMLMDLIELRKRNWVPRHNTNAPMTIAEIHEAFYKADKRRSASTSDGRNIPRIAEEAKRKIKVMVDEYWSMKDKKEVAVRIKELPVRYFGDAIREFIESALDKKPDDVSNCADLLKELRKQAAICPADCKKAFTDIIDNLEDIGIDVPQAYAHTGQLLHGARIELHEVAELIRPLTDIGGSEPPSAKVVAGYLNSMKASMGEQMVLRQVKNVRFDFASLFPDGNEDALNRFLEKQGLNILKKM